MLSSLNSLVEWLPQHIPTVILEHLRHPTPLEYTAGGIGLWLCIVRALRWRRHNAIHAKYGPKWNDGRGQLLPQEAQEIIHVSIVYDMPFLLFYTYAFALFKTYGIPSISKLLAATKQLMSKDTVSRRYIDTVILISTWNQCPITGFADHAEALENARRGPSDARPAEDPRANIAIARTNWLHSKYNISNEDFLYTLCLFVLEPGYWTDRYGWRRLSPMEKDAYFVFWKDVGGRMGIQDIPETLQDMQAWSQAYEEKHMVPAQSNRKVAGFTVDELLSVAPRALGIKALGERVVVCLLEETTRKAMMYDAQPALLAAGVRGLLHAIALVQRFLLPPRVVGMWTVESGPPRNLKLGEMPRMHPNRLAAAPWYKAESASAVGYYVDKFLVKVGWHDHIPCPQLKSNGYRIEEMGPVHFEHEGHEEVMRQAAELQGCPVTGPWSLEGRQ